MENSFALLGGEEGEDFSTFLERLASEAKAKEQQQKRNTESVRADSGRGTGGQGGGSWTSGRNDGQQFGNGYGNGYQRDNRGSGGYQQNNGGINGYQRSNESVDRYRRNNGQGNGYQQSYGSRGRGASGRGRGPVRAQNGHDGAENESQIIEGNQQVENQEQGGETDGAWEKVIRKQHRNGNSSYGDGRRQNGGGRFRGRGGRNNGNGYVTNNSGAKEAKGSSENHSINGDDDIGNVSAATEVSKDDVQDYSEKKVEDEVVKEAIGNVQEEKEEESRIKSQEEEEKEARRKARLEESKKLTLEQYQKQLLEKRKALEDLKTEERKVALDKDFESMQLVRKKKEDSLFIRQDYVNGKLKKKDDKILKSVSIDEFLKRAEGDNRKRGDFQGRGGGGYQLGTLSRQATDRANGDRFPHPAEGKERFANFDRSRVGGGDRGRGGSTRGSSADPLAGDALRDKPVQPSVPAFDDSIQFPGLRPSIK